MKNSYKTIVFLLILLISFTNVSAQLDERFGAAGVEGTTHLGQKGLKWYKDWQDSYLLANYPPPGKQKIWTVGKIDYRTDDLGMDYRWIILDLLENTNINFLQSFLNLCLTIVENGIIPNIDDYWETNIPALETSLEEMLNNFTFTGMKYRVKYRAKCKKTHITFQEELPEFELLVKEDGITFNTSLSVDWTTHIFVEAWVLNPNPFNWGYHWKDIGDADCDFKTTVNISGEIGIFGRGRDRHLQVKIITPDSRTKSDIDWSALGIDFTWADLSNSVENMIDEQIEKTFSDELNKEPITNPFYFVNYFKSLFTEDEVPTQGEILQRIFQGEKKHIQKVLSRRKFEGGYWTIGYEPNWFPLMEPEQYAKYFTNYYRFIKALDPEARVLGPSINLTEAIDNPGDIAFAMIPPFFLGMFSGIENELKDLINSYFQDADSKAWYSQFIESLPTDVSIDVNDFHIFPMKAENKTVEWDSIKILMDDMALFMRSTSRAKDVWVSEFGNSDWNRSENDAANLCRNFSQYFKSNTVGIKKWFWFLSRGHSPFYDLPLGLDPPFTALLDKNFSLTQIGTTYLNEADNTPPIVESAPTGDALSANLIKINIHFQWEEAKEFDTGISDYQLIINSEPHELIIFDQWLDNRLFYSIAGKPGQTYYARIRAKNGAGLISDWSDWSQGINSSASGEDDSMDFVIADSTESDRSVFQQHGNNNISQNPQYPETAAVNFNNLPDNFNLSQNCPNPFNSSTGINYQLPEDSFVIIKIYNGMGQEIKTLVNENKTAANYSINWNGRDNLGNPVVSGVYLYQIQAGNYFCCKKLILMK
ncbi:T9SS type A sorting domain-containing protein [candidate division KSB1 bacterium]|nr:T9SS type A sorting domain-containing protein [candidate division KSB1 bacterium]